MTIRWYLKTWCRTLRSFLKVRYFLQNRVKICQVSQKYPISVSVQTEKKKNHVKTLHKLPKKDKNVLLSQRKLIQTLMTFYKKEEKCEQSSMHEVYLDVFAVGLSESCSHRKEEQKPTFHSLSTGLGLFCKAEFRLKFRKVLLHSFFNCYFKYWFLHGSLMIPPHHLGQFDVWALTRPLLHLDSFLFQSFCCGFATLFGIDFGLVRQTGSWSNDCRHSGARIITPPPLWASNSLEIDL